jgi:GntR family transcriptional repressor for pyruvate dehydrogenase complex
LIAKGLKKRSFRRGRLSEQVVTELEAMIAQEYATAGGRLPKESELADRFHVSRIVIREAMKILEGRGVVEVRAGSGTYTIAPSVEKVKESLLRLFRDQPIPTVTEMEQILEIREVLEEAVASLAAIRATPEDLAVMKDALKGMEAGGDAADVIEADLLFHRAVAKAAHNPYFEMVIEPLMAVFVQQVKLTDSYDIGADLHVRIAEEIEKGNSVGARQAVRRLMRHTLEDGKKAIGVMERAHNQRA